MFICSFFLFIFKYPYGDVQKKKKTYEINLIVSPKNIKNKIISYRKYLKIYYLHDSCNKMRLKNYAFFISVRL